MNKYNTPFSYYLQCDNESPPAITSKYLQLEAIHLMNCKHVLHYKYILLLRNVIDGGWGRGGCSAD